MRCAAAMRKCRCRKRGRNLEREHGFIGGFVAELREILEAVFQHRVERGIEQTFDKTGRRVVAAAGFAPLPAARLKANVAGRFPTAGLMTGWSSSRRSYTEPNSSVASAP